MKSPDTNCLVKPPHNSVIGKQFQFDFPEPTSYNQEHTAKLLQRIIHIFLTMEKQITDEVLSISFP